MDEINSTNLAMLTMFNKHGMTAINYFLVCIMFIMKEPNSQLSECQRHNEHYRLDLMEDGFVHLMPSVKCLRPFSSLNLSLLYEADVPFGIERLVNESPLSAFA